MIVNLNTMKLNGMNGQPVTVECEITNGIGIHVVGLADSSTKELLLRVITAMQSMDYYIPGKRIIVNLAPKDLLKSSCRYDLPVLLALIAASGQDKGQLQNVSDYMIVGEVGLDGSVRRVSGCVQAVKLALEMGLKGGVIIPDDNWVEVADLFGGKIPVYPVKTAGEAICVISGKAGEKSESGEPRVKELMQRLQEEEAPERDKPWWHMLDGNESVKRALEISAAGGHGLLVTGAAGSGRSIIAHALTDILPELDDEKALELSLIHSCQSVSMRPYQGIHSVPFETVCPHSSLAEVLGGGAGGWIAPGKVSLANEGVLLVEEANELGKSLDAALYNAVVGKEVTISRLHTKVTYPARVHTVLSAQLCPCGKYGSGDECNCSKAKREQYLGKLRGLTLYKDCAVQVFAQYPFNYSGKRLPNAESVEDVKARVEAAMALQRKRYATLAWKCNNDIPNAHVVNIVNPAQETLEILDKLIERLGLSMHSYAPALRMARTIADLAACEQVLPCHVAEAVSFRFVDKMTEVEEEKAMTLENAS